MATGKSRKDHRGAGRAVKAARGNRRVLDLALELGCSESMVRMVERGERRPALADVPRWCEVLGLAPELFYPELETIYGRMKP